MAKFNLKEHIAKNQATFFGSLTEGQFSWMTQDTGQQIGSEEENTIPVYMFDNKGNFYYENRYDGYGDFGGKDYYELLAQMNGYAKGDRMDGIDMAFGKMKTPNGGPVLFPALVTKPNEFDYKTHDFTKEAETDPNQSWYAPEEEDFIDQNDEEVYGYDEEEDTDLELQENKPTTKMKKSELKAKIKEMIVAEIALDIDNMEDAPESEVDFLAELEGMLNEAEGLTPLQDYVYNYEKDISGEDEAQEFLDDIRKLKTPQDVYDYYSIDRDLEGSDLNNIFRQVKRKFANLITTDDLTPLQRRAYSYTKERFGNDEAKKSLDQIKTLKTGQEFTDWVNQKLKNVSEAKGDEEVTDDVTADDVTVDDTETIDTETTTEVNPDVKAVQDALTQAQAAAQKLGDAKLTDQIGNTITFFTRAHVVEKGAVAEGDLMKNIGKGLEYEATEEMIRDYADRLLGAGVDDVEDLANYYLSNPEELPEPMKYEFFKNNYDDILSVAMTGLGEGKKEDKKEKDVAKDLNEAMFPLLKRILK